MRLPHSRREAGALTLALQGGGAHGAFTWGVLDALLELGVPMAAISGASAGAMNAVVLASGLAAGGADGARAALEAFWRAIAERMPPLWHVPGDPPRLTGIGHAWLAWSRWLAPSQINPLDVNPLREVLAQQVDFDRLRSADGPALFVSATDVAHGRLRLLRRHELTLDALLASACLPQIAHAVLLDGRAHWDGAFSANPALFPLVRDVPCADLMIVTLGTLRDQPLPSSAAEIAARTLEIGFNAAFLREARWLAELADAGRGLGGWWRAGGIERRLARLRWHLIDADDAVGALPSNTRLLPERDFLLRLRDQGREAALQWWRGGSFGRRSSVDLLRTFGA
jgi:NTE family protein